MSATKRRSTKNLQGSQTSLTRQDEMELQNKSRPQSSASRKAWDQDGPGQDDVDFSPRNQHALDLPSGMAAEPYSMQTQITHDVRADAKNEPVDCFTRFKKGIRGIIFFIKLHNRAYFSFFIYKQILENVCTDGAIKITLTV